MHWVDLQPFSNAHKCMNSYAPQMPPPKQTNTRIHTPLPQMGYPVVSIYITMSGVWSSAEMEIPQTWRSINISLVLLYWTFGCWYLISFNIMYLCVLYLLCCKLMLSTATTTKTLFTSFQHKIGLLHNVIKMSHRSKAALLKSFTRNQKHPSSPKVRSTRWKDVLLQL